MKKRIISLVLCIALCLSCISITSFASDARDISHEETLAASLKSLGLFKGVSDTEFDLERKPTRAEALVMLIRVLGKESEALEGTYSHPFIDVPEWADKYVGYGYENKLTSGVSKDRFGASVTASAAMYCTFMLRALGYSDTNGKDFTWDDPFSLAVNIGVLPSFADTEEFLRADAVSISYASLPVHIKDTPTPLYQKLIDAGVFTKEEFDTYYDFSALYKPSSPIQTETQNENTTDESSQVIQPSSSKTELTSEQIFAKCSPAVFCIEVYDKYGQATGLGSGFFIDDKGTAVTNYHVIKGANSAYAITSSDNVRWKIEGVYDYNEEKDWAIIKVETDDYPYLTIGSPDTIVGGAVVYAIGNPQGFTNTISNGLISNPAQNIGNNVTYIQISVPISPGSSGGALINKYGDVIGVTTAGYTDGQNLNFAIPISYIDGYDTSALTPLSEMNYNPKKVIEVSNQGGTAQAEAFYSVAAWSIYNANTSIDGLPAFVQYNYDSELGSSVFCSIAYDSDYDAMYLSLYVSDDVEGIEAMATIVLTPEENEFDAAFTASTTYGDYFEGYAIIDAQKLTPDTIVPFVEYDSSYTIPINDATELASMMYCALIAYFDTIIESHISYDFSSADFGFTNLYN